MTVYVCIECADDTRSGCMFTTKREVLPILCGPDCQGYAKVPKFMEVPDKKQTKLGVTEKIGYPERLARPEIYLED